MKRIAILTAILAGILLVALGGCRMPFCPTEEDPFVVIDKPPAPPSPGTQIYGKVIVFGWHAGSEAKLRAVRWLWSQVVDTNGVYDPNFDIIRDLNLNPERYEDKWSNWVPYSSPKGRTTTLGDDETLALNRSHIFAVQAMDFCGKVTQQFDRRTNVRQFIVSSVAGPLLTVAEPYLGYAKFLGMNTPGQRREFVSNVALNFRWRADASQYGGEIAGYRYGWDVVDIEDPNDWAVKFSPRHTSAPPKVLASGVHTFFVEAIDNVGNISLGRIEVTVVPFAMDRTLLWVDDYPSTNFTQIDYALPTESEHDQFWLSICGRAREFDAGRDVYDAYYDYNRKPPTLEYMGRYRNIIWSYGSSADYGALDDVIRFVPESMVGASTVRGTNALSIFLAKGGHVLTEGQAERAGGLAACLPQQAQSFPMSLECEITGNRADCSGDRSGVYSMPYREYCITMLDKIVAYIRSDAGMPTRRVRNYDCMTHALRADDPVTLSLAGLPERLDLWEEVTKPGRYFDFAAPEPRPGGFTLVEAYDPAYWMMQKGATSQSCFHPMFRMRAKSSFSALNNAAVAVVLTKYENVAPGGGAWSGGAKSFHFGLPLWYFNRAQVDQIVGVVFGEWGIEAAR